MICNIIYTGQRIQSANKIKCGTTKRLDGIQLHVNDDKFWYHCHDRRHHKGSYWLKVDVNKDKVQTTLYKIEFETPSKLYQQLSHLQKWPKANINKNYDNYPNTFRYLKKIWIQIIKKLKQQQQRNNDDNNNNNNNKFHSDDDDDYNNGNTNDEDDDSMYSPSSTSSSSNKDKYKNKRKKKPKDKIKRKSKKKTTGKEEIEENEQMEEEEITFEKVQKHCDKIMSKKKRNAPKMMRFGNGAMFYVHFPSFQDQDLASGIQELLRKVQKIQKYDPEMGAEKLIHHPATRTPKYIVIDQELTFEELEEICADYEWWMSNSVNIIKVDSLFSELMKWNQFNGSIQQHTMMKLWNEGKGMVKKLKKNNNGNTNNDNGEEMMDLTETDYKETAESDDVRYIGFEYEKVTKKPNQYLLSSDNIWRLYQICNQDNLHQHLEMISTEVVSYICGTEWENNNEEKQSKMNNNPCWDEKNQKRKDGTGYSIHYAMKYIFGSGKQAMNKDWWKKKALFFTLNDVPVTYDSLNSEKQRAGHHWFSMAVQQYHDNKTEKITKIDWNIFDSFNDKNINNKFKNSHIKPIRCFLSHIYNRIQSWNITVPEQPKQTMYQCAQPDGNNYDCGIYCCISLNYLFQQFTGLNETNKNKNKNKNRKNNVKLSEIDTIPMKQGYSAVSTLRQLLTNDIQQQYKTITKGIIEKSKKDSVTNGNKIEQGQYLSYRKKNNDPLPKHAFSWTYIGKIIRFSNNDKSDDQIEIVGVNTSDRDKPIKFKENSIDFINTYQWKIMNAEEKNEFKTTYQKTIEQHAFSDEKNDNNNNDNNNNNNGNDAKNNTDSPNKQQRTKVRGRRKRNLTSAPSPSAQPSKKRKIDNSNSNSNNNNNDNSNNQTNRTSKSSHPKRGTKRKHNQISNSEDSKTESETEEGDDKEKHSSSSASSTSSSSQPQKKRKLMNTSSNQTKKL